MDGIDLPAQPEKLPRRGVRTKLRMFTEPQLFLIVCVCGVALRVAVLCTCPGLSDALDSRVDIVTPVTSYKRFKEGVFLLLWGVEPYSSDLVHQSPLLLRTFPHIGHPGFIEACTFALADLIGAYSLALLARKRPNRSYSPTRVAAVYLFNPFTLLACLAKSSAVFVNASMCYSFAGAITGRPGTAMVFLGLAAVLGWYPLYFVLPVIIICAQHTFRHWPLRKMVGWFLGSIAGFLGLSYAAAGSWSFLHNVYGVQILYTDYSRPNMGMWWYYFVELFASFRTFFLGVFQAFLAVFTVPYAIRFPHEPVFVIAATQGLFTAFKPYPEASDLGLFFSLLVLNKRVCEVMRYKMLFLLALLYIAVLGPTYYNLWIFIGSGNANFFYAMTLVYSLTLTLAIIEITWTAVRLDYDGGHNKNLMQI